jgi:hypothetical protein
MQVIIDEIVNTVRAIDRDMIIAPDIMRQIVEACVRAVQDCQQHEQRSQEERSVTGPKALDPGRDF